MSTLRVNTLQNTSGVEVYTCKAWVNFNGTGTAAIRASGNVSSITDNGTGDYTINFTSALTDGNYCVNFSFSSDTGGTFTNVAAINPAINSNYTSSALATPTSSACRVSTSWTGSGRPDPTYCCVSVFR
jgi:hypothetical protein